MDIEPRIIFFIIILVIGAIRALASKAQKKNEQQERYTWTYDNMSDSSQAQNQHDDPMHNFRAMIEEARREADQSVEVVQTPDLPPPPPPAPVVQTTSAYSTPAAPEPEILAYTPPSTTKLQSQEFPNVQKSKKNQKADSSDLSLKALLRSPAAARNAIILTEVLGKPKSLQ